MNMHHLAAQAIGSDIGLGVVALYLSFQKSMWIRHAHKLAARSNIALPGPFADRVARLLCNQYLYGMCFALVISPLANAATLSALQGDGKWAAQFPWFLIGLPAFLAIFSFLVCLGPRLKASGGYRVAHLDRLSVRDAFTQTELAAVIVGLITTAGLGDWGLWYIKASATWWLACAASLAVTYVAGWYAATRLMNRPPSASDALELGWDDLLRFRNVRSLTVAVAWTPAACVYLADCFMMSLFAQKFTAPGEVGYQLEWWPILTPVAVCLVLSLVFRQGRQLWRRAWQERAA